MAEPRAHRASSDLEPTLEQLRGDCARMADRWVAPAAVAPAPVSPSLIHRVVVPPASARLIDRMPEYGG
ncbi:hypothetical protein ACFVIM_35035 [Streptomyces sp. NPDC057638]|uniref:hypothetical protein n=1 Tax=Streptomyces sp. NPDC057638 TaxID=3346190 RepID=UPI0036ACDA5F